MASKSKRDNAGSGPPAALTCIPKRLPDKVLEDAARKAWKENPQNYPMLRRLAGRLKAQPTALEVALITSKYWGARGVDLSVSFLESASSDVRRRILSHMNAWADRGANIRFRETSETGDVRIAFERSGYWSYVGTDIRSIPISEATMNLQEFNSNTPESEFVRVVRHETGHTIGFTHEHLRRQLVNEIDVEKAVRYFGSTQGWTRADVFAQVLTPVEEQSIMATEQADKSSIMCYEIPAEITTSGRRIVGGNDIDEEDFKFVGGIYPAPEPERDSSPDEEFDEEPQRETVEFGARRSRCGRCEPAATIEIFSDRTRITLGRPPAARGKAGRSGVLFRAPAPPIPATADEAVEECLRANAMDPGATWDDTAPVGSIVQFPDDVASCLNDGYLAQGTHFKQHEIQKGWSVRRLKSETKKREP